MRYHYKHAVIYYPSTVMPSESGHPGRPTGSPGSWTSASALGHAHMFGRYRSYREPLPLSAPKGGEGDTIPRGLRSAAAGVFRFGSLDPAKQRITAAEQRESPLFLRSPSRRRPRIPAENAITFADNFLRKQRKQREAAFAHVWGPRAPWKSWHGPQRMA